MEDEEGGLVTSATVMRGPWGVAWDNGGVTGTGTGFGTVDGGDEVRAVGWGDRDRGDWVCEKNGSEQGADGADDAA